MQTLRRTRRLSIPAILAGVVALALPGAAGAQTASLTVSPAVVRAGGSIEVVGHCPDGAAGETEVSVFAGGGFEGGLLGRVPIAQDGALSGSVTIPANAPSASGEISVPCPTGGTILTAPLTVENTDPFSQEIDWLLAQGIATGYDDGTFRGATPVSRQAMAAFVYRLAHDGADAPACTAPPFPDVSVDNRFCGEIAWLEEQDLSGGYDDGTYRPTAEISRQAMAAFFYRLFNQAPEPPACEVSPFADVRPGDPFCPEIFWMLDTGISSGYDDATYRPTWPVSRQAMAAFMYRAVVEKGLTVA